MPNLPFIAPTTLSPDLADALVGLGHRGALRSHRFEPTLPELQVFLAEASPAC